MPPASTCLDVPGFSAMDSYPTRSPLLIADYLISLVRGRRYVELGTRNGDIMACVSRFARTATAVEVNREYCRSARARGLQVLCQPVE